MGGEIVKRKDWLLSKDLGIIQSNGAFSLRSDAMQKLHTMELVKVGEYLAKERNIQFSRLKANEGEPYIYVGQTKLESGYWAVVTKTGKELQMVYTGKKPDFKAKDIIEFKSLGNKQFEPKAVELSKQQTQNQTLQRVRDIDKEQDLER